MKIKELISILQEFNQEKHIEILNDLGFPHQIVNVEEIGVIVVIY